MRRVDLHVHSSRSDGTLSPGELVDLAAKKDLAAFALTDHDTVDGLDEAFERGKQREALRLPVPEIIPGIEFSTEYQKGDVHILGLCIDWRSEAFALRLREFVDSRTRRNQRMCALLREAGVDITYEALLAAFPERVITRAHYARYLLEHGYVGSMSEAFDRYVGDHCPCYVPREKVTPIQAVAMILEAGGVPILAHPILYRMSDEKLEGLIRECREAGLLGIEAIYSTYKPADERRIRSLAAKYGLLISGGSDFHGSNKPGLELGSGYGGLCVPWEVLEKIKEAAGR